MELNMTMKKYKYVWILTLAFGLALLLGTGSTVGALAQDGTPEIPDDAVNAIAKQMYCPVCENIPLDVCGTKACDDWRELIRTKLAEGWDEQQIKDYFVVQYGDRVLAEPPRRGLNWLVYVIPPIAIVVGIYLVAQVLRSWQQAAPVPAAEKDLVQHEDEYKNRLEEELRKRS